MSVSSTQTALQPLLAELAGLIRQARQQAVRAVDAIQVQTCWEVGRHIVEFGKGFDERNLRLMRAFYQAFLFGTHCVPN